jgi:hypothetical protein
VKAPSSSFAERELGGAIFAPYAKLLDSLPRGRWPTHAELTALARGIETGRGMALRFVAPRTQHEGERRPYEERIAATGEVETRLGNWHDLFNALVWIAFPRSKAAVNRAHALLLAERGAAEARNRSSERDALTLFDEGGVVVASSSPGLLRLIAEHEWKALFWTRRAELERNARFFAFGHALLEKALEPYLGIVAKTVFIDVDADFMLRPADEQVAIVDERLAAHFEHRGNFATPKVMRPMPVLGVPGWHRDNAREEFYDDRSHFRGKPTPGSDPKDDGEAHAPKETGV